MASVMGTGPAALIKALSGPLTSRERQDDSGAQAHERKPKEPLSAVIEGEVIPRLMMRHSINKGAYSPADVEAKIGAEAAERFAALPLKLEADELLVEVEAFLDRGASIDAIFPRGTPHHRRGNLANCGKRTSATSST